MKTYDYIIVLKKRSYAMIDGISQLMLLLTIAAYIYTATQYQASLPVALVFCIAIISWLAFCYWQKQRGVQPFYRLALLFAAVGWYMQKDGIWISLIYLIAAMLEKQVKFPEEIAFDSEEIVMNTFPKKRFNWSELNNIVLKDGLLTIDFKNNKLIQKELDETADEKVEQEFNLFVQEKISRL